MINQRNDLLPLYSSLNESSWRYFVNVETKCISSILLWCRTQFPACNGNLSTIVLGVFVTSKKFSEWRSPLLKSRFFWFILNPRSDVMNDFVNFAGFWTIAFNIILIYFTNDWYFLKLRQKFLQIICFHMPEINQVYSARLGVNQNAWICTCILFTRFTLKVHIEVFEQLSTTYDCI